MPAHPSLLCLPAPAEQAGSSGRRPVTLLLQLLPLRDVGLLRLPVPNWLLRVLRVWAPSDVWGPFQEPAHLESCRVPLASS